MSVELPALPALLFDVPLVDGAELFGVACVAARRGVSADATDLAADAPDVPIELSCDKSIVRSPLSFASKVRLTWLTQARMLSQLPPPTYVASGDAPLSSNTFKFS